MGKSRPQQVFCYRVVDETGGTGSGEQKERCGSLVKLLVSLEGVALGLTGSTNYVCPVEQTKVLGKGV